VGALIIEGASRFLESESSAPNGLDLTLQPYVMFAGSGYARNLVWRNQETRTDIRSRMTFNNLGFAEAGDFSFPADDAFVREFGKKPGEKLVLITGASVVHGVGATSNENTIAAQLQRALNDNQTRQRYRVVNMGMGSWIAYQEFVGLSIFGAPLKPDWIVTMDGANDGSTVCSQGGGPGNPLEWPMVLYLAGGGQQTSYRGQVLQWLVEHAAAARLITGQKKSAPNDQVGQVYVDEDDPDPRFRMKLRGLKVADLDRQVDFYLQAQRNMVTLFSSANVLLSSEPLLRDNGVTETYRRAFDFSRSEAEMASSKRQLATELDAYMARSKDTKCGSGLNGPTVGYFMARSALRLEQAAGEWSSRPAGRSVLYTNVEMLFPNRFGMRLANFIDNFHLSDLGQRRIAEFFAGYILKADMGMPFDPAKSSERVFAETMKMRVASPVSADDQPAKAPGKAVDVTGRPVGLVVAQVKPDALRIEEEAHAGLHQVTWSGVPVSTHGDSVVSIDARFGQVDVVRIEIRDGSASDGWSEIDLGAQTIKSGGTIGNALIEDLGKGWRRISLTVPFKSDVASVAFALTSLDGNATEYAGVGRSMVMTLPVVRPQ
jgi:lysophospholipase L1-like esterase